MELVDTPPAADTGTQLLVQLIELLGCLKEAMNTTTERLGLSVPQGIALYHLRPGQTAPMRELAEKMHCDASNVTGIIARLEAVGLVERRQCVADRRVKELGLTRAGATVREHIVAASVAALPFRNLDHQQQQQLTELLDIALASRLDAGPYAN